MTICYITGGSGSGDGGSSWSVTGADAAIKGINVGDNNHSSGIYVSSSLGATNTGGVIGANSKGSVYGAQAYFDGTTAYGIYTPDRLFLGGVSNFNGNMTIGGIFRITTNPGTRYWFQMVLEMHRGKQTLPL